MSDWKNSLKGGWRPEKGGPGIRDQVKSFIGRGDDSSTQSSSEHTAAPLSSLRDPSSFGPPPKRIGARSPAPPPPLPSSTKPNGPPPSLPPRLPPRSSTASPALSPVSTPGGTQSPSYFNQGAISRLGAAGVSVPGFGIGGKSAAPPPPPPARSPTATSASTPTGGESSAKSYSGHLSDLQGRFSRFSTSASGRKEPVAAPAAPSQGTTWAEKQAALKTAAAFKKDPTSVSFADAKIAAGTAHNFHQRHGDQVASGMKTANGLSQRFGVNEKVFGNNGGQAGQGSSSPMSALGQISGVIAKKKPPPPPPSKKPQLFGARSEGAAPPPVPSSTRPKF